MRVRYVMLTEWRGGVETKVYINDFETVGSLLRSQGIPKEYAGRPVRVFVKGRGQVKPGHFLADGQRVVVMPEVLRAS